MLQLGVFKCSDCYLKGYYRLKIKHGFNFICKERAVREYVSIIIVAINVV